MKHQRPVEHEGSYANQRGWEVSNQWVDCRLVMTGLCSFLRVFGLGVSLFYTHVQSFTAINSSRRPATGGHAGKTNAQYRVSTLKSPNQTRAPLEGQGCNLQLKGKGQQ